MSFKNEGGENRLGLVFFPTPKEDSIDLEMFLKASKGMVLLVDDLGRLFGPLSYDMSNNITKIQNGYGNLECTCIEDLLLIEKANGQCQIADALLWLKRSLHFFLVFFRRLISDETGQENLESVMVTAYQASLEPYHGWFTRQLFSFFKKTCPPRSVVLDILAKRLQARDDVLQKLQQFCTPLDANIDHINALFRQHNLDVSVKAP